MRLRKHKNPKTVNKQHPGSGIQSSIQTHGTLWEGMVYITVTRRSYCRRWRGENRGSAGALFALKHLYIWRISSGLDEQLEVLVSLITVLPRQSSEHDLLEKIIDPLHSLRSQT